MSLKPRETRSGVWVYWHAEGVVSISKPKKKRKARPLLLSSWLNWRDFIFFSVFLSERGDGLIDFREIVSQLFPCVHWESNSLKIGLRQSYFFPGLFLSTGISVEFPNLDQSFSFELCCWLRKFYHRDTQSLLLIELECVILHYFWQDGKRDWIVRSERSWTENILWLWICSINSSLLFPTSQIEHPMFWDCCWIR